jgi:6-phosphogluconate dehydrogenase (decarboxylating)
MATSASGARHFVKMVHNGIEYGLMEAYTCRRHFEMALEYIGEVSSHFHDVLNEMISRCFRLEDYKESLTLDVSTNIKTVTKVETFT